MKSRVLKLVRKKKNPVIIDILEEALRKAKRGEVLGLGLVYNDGKEVKAAAEWGKISRIESLGAIEFLKHHTLLHEGDYNGECMD